MAEKPTYLPLSCDKPDLLGKPQNKTKKKKYLTSYREMVNQPQTARNRAECHGTHRVAITEN